MSSRHAPTHDIRPLTRDEVDVAVDWAAAEGWNPGLADAGAFHAADDGAFIGASVDGTLVSCIAAVRYGPDYGFIGFYLCRPEWRGRGLGYAVWQAGMARLAGRAIGLDGVVDQQSNYAREGFVYAHANYRYGGPPRALGARADGIIVRPADAADRAMTGAYDDAVFGVPRDSFLDAWLDAPGHRVLLAARPDKAGMAGYAVVRPCREGHKIGPLFADDAATARVLHDACIDTTGGSGPVFLDIPDTNPAARMLATAAGLEPVFETARMYKGNAPVLPIDRVYGITTFELG